MPGEILEEKEAQSTAAVSLLPIDSGESRELAPPAPPPSSPPPLPTADIATCANCTSLLTGPYCSQCGQHIADFHRSLWRLTAEFFDNLFCWDNKWFRTLVPLLDQPGFLTQEFMDGRRVRYVLPLRLFLFTSAVCLTLLQYQFNHGLKRTHASASDERKVREVLARLEKGDFGEEGKSAVSPSASPAATAVSPAPVASPTPGPKGDRDDDDDDDEAKPSPAAKSGKSKDLRAEQAKAIARQMGRELGEHFDKVGGIDGVNREVTKTIEGIEHKISWASLAILPLFALLLRSVYWRQDGLYFAHLIFSLHYHTFLLLFWTAHSLLNPLSKYLGFIPFGFILMASWLLPPVYLYLALQRIYQESPQRTGTKVIVIGSIHLVTLIAALAIAGVLSAVGM